MLSEVYGIQPWNMLDLSAHEYKQLADDLRQKRAAAEKQRG